MSCIKIPIAGENHCQYESWEPKGKRRAASQEETLSQVEPNGIKLPTPSTAWRWSKQEKLTKNSRTKTKNNVLSLLNNTLKGLGDSYQRQTFWQWVQHTGWYNRKEFKPHTRWNIH